MTVHHVIGIDPGPTPGFVHLTLRLDRRLHQADIVQCSESAALTVLCALLGPGSRTAHGEAPAIVAVERFVVGRGSGKSGRAGGVTRDLVGQLIGEAQSQPNVTVVQENASRVKHWATDRRLQAVKTAGTDLLELTKGMRHARDAARHALFAAVQHAGVTDPLSKRANPEGTA